MDKLIKPRLGLPNLGLGVGLRNKHFNYLLHNPPVVDWFEIISENFMDDFGFARHVLMHVRKDVPVVMHGVSMSIGSTDPLNFDYLQKLKDLARIIEPEWISDHLCWTGVANINTHDLLPMPMTEESLNHVCERIGQVQDFLQRPLILENPSTYLQFKASTIPEWEFLSALALRTGCGLLLDANNVFVSAHNHGFDAVNYINSLPHNQIVQMHIAGPTDCGDLLIDTHDQPVPTQVWKLYQLAQQLSGGVSSLLEWDAKIPDYPDLITELFKAKEVMKGNIPGMEIQSSQTMPVSNPVDFQLQAAHA
jgi:uncharacterized protein (UPF0276 family)